MGWVVLGIGVAPILISTSSIDGWAQDKSANDLPCWDTFVENIIDMDWNPK